MSMNEGEEKMPLNIPTDPIILCSFINTMLRDGYNSLDDFCNANDVDKDEIIEKLTSAGFSYDEEKKRFL